MSAYYNEIDPFCCEWLRNLIAEGVIAPGEVDERDIREVRAGDLRGFDQCHYFAGCGAWSYALRLAGWPDARPVWTGSPPCQPFSVAGKRQATRDPRHLWPAWCALIGECRPRTCFGEQVGSGDGMLWLDHVLADLEALGYAVGAVDLPACGFGAPHIRNRLFFVADAAGRGRGEFGDAACTRRGGHADGASAPCELGDAGRPRLPASERERLRGARRGDEGRAVAEPGEPDAGALDHAAGARHDHALKHPGRSPPQRARPEQPGAVNGFWRAASWLACRDGRARPIGPGIAPLAHGLPASLGRLEPGLRALAELAGLSAASLRAASRNRTGRLRAYGNAIVAPVAASVIRAYLDMIT